MTTSLAKVTAAAPGDDKVAARAATIRAIINTPGPIPLELIGLTDEQFRVCGEFAACNRDICATAARTGINERILTAMVTSELAQGAVSWFLFVAAGNDLGGMIESVAFDTVRALRQLLSSPKESSKLEAARSLLRTMESFERSKNERLAQLAREAQNHLLPKLDAEARDLDDAALWGAIQSELSA